MKTICFLGRAIGCKCVAIIAGTALVTCTAFASTPNFTAVDGIGYGSTLGLSWGDSDSDGDLDLAASNSGEQNHLYRNNYPTLSFTQLSRFDQGNGAVMVWGDYDNDGDLDLAAVNYMEQNKLYRNEGSNSFTELDRFGPDNNRTKAMAWGDVDNDGDLDLAVSNYGQNWLFENVGSDSFGQHNLFGGGFTEDVAWGDYDNDGDLDLAVGVYSLDLINPAPNRLYRNDGSLIFTEMERFGAGFTYGLSWGDYDNDGDLDLAVANDMGNNPLYRNDGSDVFTFVENLGSGNSYGIAWGDYDNDGDLDAAVANLSSQCLLFENTLPGFTQHTPFGGNDGEVLVWGDYDQDGDIDVAMGRIFSQENKLYRNNENDGNYLIVQCVGSGESNFTNKSGVGVKVRCYEAGTDNLLGYREVSSGNEGFGMNSLEAEFGVSSGGTYDIEVTWTTGCTDWQRDVTGGSRITIEESGIESPIDVVITPSGMHAILSWSSVNCANWYRIYADDTNPFFTPDSAHLIWEHADTTYVDWAAIMFESMRFYKVTADRIP